MEAGDAEDEPGQAGVVTDLGLVRRHPSPFGDERFPVAVEVLEVPAAKDLGVDPDGVFVERRSPNRDAVVTEYEPDNRIGIEPAGGPEGPL
jgi:hypothetical protein